MKIEIIKETKPWNDEVWYGLYVDGEYLTGSSEQETIVDRFNKAVADPEFLKKKREILKSAEIDISLQENKTI